MIQGKPRHPAAPGWPPARRTESGGRVGADNGFLGHRTINGILAMDSFKKDFGTIVDSAGVPIAITANQTSTVVAILSAGATLGALIAAPVGDHFGRRRSLIGSICVFTAGVIFQVCAVNITLLLVGR